MDIWRFSQVQIVPKCSFHAGGLGSSQSISRTLFDRRLFFSSSIWILLEDYKLPTCNKASFIEGVIHYLDCKDSLFIHALLLISVLSVIHWPSIICNELWALVPWHCSSAEPRYPPRGSGAVSISLAFLWSWSWISVENRCFTSKCIKVEHVETLS